MHSLVVVFLLNSVVVVFILLVLWSLSFVVVVVFWCVPLCLLGKEATSCTGFSHLCISYAI